LLLQAYGTRESRAGRLDDAPDTIGQAALTF